MKTLLFLVSILFLFIISACHYNPGSSGDVPETGVITPLAAYNDWTFERTDYPLNGASIESIDSITIPNHLKINQATGVTWYPYTDRTGMWRAANLSDPNFPGFWRVGENLINPQLWYKYPAKVGESFRWGPVTITYAFPTPAKKDSVITLTANSTDMLVTAKNMTIVVPAGSFPCYKYEANYKSGSKVYLQIIEYVSPNVGKIMEEQYGLDYGSNSLRLISQSKLTSKKLGY